MQRQNNWWMFWGNFFGCHEGDHLFQERQWGKILANGYTEHILARIVNWIRRTTGPDCRPTRFMQDKAPSHKVASSQAYFRPDETEPIFWLAFSPDPNLIEAVRSMMKSQIETPFQQLDQGKQRSRLRVREIIEEALESGTPDQLRTLIMSMPARCQAVIEADGGLTRYWSFEFFIQNKQLYSHSCILR